MAALSLGSGSSVYYKGLNGVEHLLQQIYAQFPCK